MSFYGSSFSFDGISCEEYGLMLYDFGSTKQGDSKYASIEVHEDRVPSRARSLFYGTSYSKPLEFTLVFGANEDSESYGEPIDRQDMEIIGSWLTGHSEYKWLAIDQPDMEGIRYRCIINDLETIELSMCKWAFKCTVHCDSPFAYTIPEQFTYTVDGSADIVLHSRASSNMPYYPTVTISGLLGEDVEIVNHDFNGSTFRLLLADTNITDVVANGETGILSGSIGNLYSYFNFCFPALVRGVNHLSIKGSGTYTFTCEFPVNVGG